MNFKHCDDFVKEFENVIKNPKKGKSSVYYTGIDLGTACVVMAVLDENYRPVAGAFQYADVVKDGMVVDYIGAIRLVGAMKEKLEDALETELIYASAAIPPETDNLDGGAVKNVVQAAGFEITSILDEPTAANKLLGMENGAVVDIGGGTTGISLIKDGEVVLVTDEATGGTHFTLVLSGAYKKPFKEADEYKRKFENHKEIFPVLKPVVEKISTIISKSVKDHQVEELVLVGGSSCLTGIEAVIEDMTGIPTHKPMNPLFVTPLGIALSCSKEIIE